MPSFTASPTYLGTKHSLPSLGCATRRADDGALTLAAGHSHCALCVCVLCCVGNSSIDMYVTLSYVNILRIMLSHSGVFKIPSTSQKYQTTCRSKEPFRNNSQSKLRFELKRMLGYLLAVSLFRLAVGANSQCSMTEVKSLLEGCDRLSGLNLTSVGGTIVDDHNCDVMLPKQVFIEEPLFTFYMADSVWIEDNSFSIAILSIFILPNPNYAKTTTVLSCTYAKFQRDNPFSGFGVKS